MEEVKYNITNHAMERYAERIAGKTEITNMRIYITDHKDDICDRIHKLINYGELIYEGKIKDYPVSKVFYKDRWVVIVDPKNNNVVTLYKVDLADDEVSDLFTYKILEKIKAEQQSLITIEEEVNAANQEYRECISRNNSEIAYFKKMIKTYEEQNDGYNLLIRSSNAKIDEKNKNITNLVETLISGRKF